MKIKMKRENLPLRSTIANRFKEIRALLGLNQKSLSDKLEIPIKNLSTIEVGGQFPTIPLIIKLYDLLRLSPLWLLTGAGEIFIKDNEPGSSQVDHFKKAFPGVPAEPDVIKMIEGMAVPVMKNALILKSLELKEVYRSHIDGYEKEKAQSISVGER